MYTHNFYNDLIKKKKLFQSKISKTKKIKSILHQSRIILDKY